MVVSEVGKGQGRQGTVIAVATAVCLCGALLFLVIGPGMFGAAQRGVFVPEGLLYLCAGAVLLLASLGLFTFLCGAVRGVRTGQGARFLSILALFLVFLAATGVFALLCGLLSAALAALLQGVLSVGGMKIAINAVTAALALFVLPVALHCIFACGTGRGPLRENLRDGFATLRKAYWRLVLLLFCAMAVGLLPAYLFSLVPADGLWLVLKVVVYTLLGSVVLLLMLGGYPVKADEDAAA